MCFFQLIDVDVWFVWLMKKILIFDDRGQKKLSIFHPFVSVFSVFFPFSRQQNQIWPTPCVSLVTQVDNTYILILFWNHRKTMIKYEITKQNSALKQNKNLLSLFKKKNPFSPKKKKKKKKK